MSNPIERLTNSVIGGDSKKAALIVSETNLYYLTAFPSTDGALLLTSEQAYYLLDFRYTEAARAKAQNVEVVEFTSLNETYKTLLKKHGITEVYMEYAALPYGHAKRFEQLSEECGAKAILNTTLDDAIRKQRIVKSDEEVKRICDAQAITDATFEHILPYIKEGVTEREIALEMSSSCAKRVQTAMRSTPSLSPAQTARSATAFRATHRSKKAISSPWIPALCSRAIIPI